MNKINPTAALTQEAQREHEQALIRYAFSLLRDLEAARDVVQDCFFRLCQQEPESVQSHTKAWLFKVCRNRALDVLKKNRRMTTLETQHLEALQEGLYHDSPAELTARRETQQEALHLLEQLPENQREVIRLRFQSDLSYRDIAEVTGLSVSNVGFLLHTGLKQLRLGLTHS